MNIFKNIIFLNESNFILDQFKTPKDIFDYLRKYIKYDSSLNWHLKDINELYNSRKGNCHDQAYFIHKALSNMKIKNKSLFFIEYNENEDIGGRTHTLTYYYKNNKIYWMETSWGGFEKIHGPFNDEESLKNYINDIHSKEPQSKHYPLLEWGRINKIKEGMNLQEYVDACLQ